MIGRIFEKRCYHCRNFVGDLKFGHCRALPPQVNLRMVERGEQRSVCTKDGDVDSNYPLVNPQWWWCGRSIGGTGAGGGGECESFSATAVRLDLP